MCLIHLPAKTFTLFRIKGSAKDSIKEAQTGLACCLCGGGCVHRTEFHEKRQGVRKTWVLSCQLNVGDTHQEPFAVYNSYQCTMGGFGNLAVAIPLKKKKVFSAPTTINCQIVPHGVVGPHW